MQQEKESSMDVHPFAETLPPVFQSVPDVEALLAEHPKMYCCPYLADKSPEEWDVSTSRRYMNQVSPTLLYLPFNVRGGDSESVREMLDWAKGCDRVAGVNITQPHKNNSVVQEFLGSNDLVDTLFKDPENGFIPQSLNATAFWEWYKAELGPVEDRQVLVVGAGGVGLPTIRLACERKGVDVFAVDVDESKLEIVSEQVERAATAASIGSLDIDESRPITVINAAGKEGVADDSDLQRLLQDKPVEGSVFVDMRPHLNIEIVDFAAQHGWCARTGNGMNEYNDYVLLQGLLAFYGEEPIGFEDFTLLVKEAS